MYTKNDILVQASKLMHTISPIYELSHPLFGTVLEIFSVKKKEMRGQNT
jgi:hypothetical protein